MQEFGATAQFSDLQLSTHTRRWGGLSTGLKSTWWPSNDNSAADTARLTGVVLLTASMTASLRHLGVQSADAGRLIRSVGSTAAIDHELVVEV